MPTCTRQTVDGRRCRNRSDRGDCGLHDRSAALPAPMAAAAVGSSVGTVDPFAAAAAWQERVDFIDSDTVTVNADDTVLATLTDRSLVVRDQAAAVVAGDEHLAKAVRASAPELPEDPRTRDDWDDLDRYQQQREVQRFDQNAARYDSLLGPMRDSWVTNQQVHLDPDGTVHSAADCKARKDRSDPTWIVPADKPTATYCTCAHEDIGGVGLLANRHAKAVERMDVAAIATELAQVERLTPAAVQAFGPRVAAVEDHHAKTHLTAALTARAKAAVSEETAAWAMRLALRLDENVDLVENDLDSRIAVAMRDAIGRDGVVDRERLIDIAVESADSAFTRKSDVRERATELVDAAASWASGREEWYPTHRSGRVPWEMYSSRPRERLGRRKIEIRDRAPASLSGTPVLWMLRTAAGKSRGRYDLGHGLASALGARTESLRDLWRQGYQRRR